MPQLSSEYLVVGIVLLVAALLMSFAVAVAVVVHLPADYFRAPGAEGRHAGERGVFFVIVSVLKNLLGAILIVIGIILSVPGLPGQGLLTVLAGVLLLDFPGKRKLLYKILSRPALLGTVNRLRLRFSRPPLIVG